jgi:hypothetical protein
VITWHGIVDHGGDDGTEPGYFDELPEFARTSNLNFYTEVQLEDVTLDWLGKDDIRMLKPDIRRKWQRVRYGKHLQSEPEALFTQIKVDRALQEQLAKWRKEARERVSKRMSLSGAGVLGKRYPRILPPGGTFAAGDTVKVRLEALGDATMRYTLDGSDTSDGRIYEQPLRLEGPETVTVKAGLSQRLPLDFNPRWHQLSETFRFVDGTRAPDKPGETKKGLELRVHDAEDFDQLHAEPGEPIHSQTVDHFTLKVPEGRNKKQDGYLYTGYVEVDKPGIYRFYTRTEGASRLYIGDRLIVDNHRRYRYDWQLSSKAPLESWGSINLEPGKHAIRVEYLRGRGFSWWEPQRDEPFAVQYEGPGVDKQPIPAQVLSH